MEYRLNRFVTAQCTCIYKPYIWIFPKFHRKYSITKKSNNSRLIAIKFANPLPPLYRNNIIIITTVILWIIDEIRYISNRNIKINANSVLHPRPLNQWWIWFLVYNIVFCFVYNTPPPIYIYIVKHLRFSLNFAVSTRDVYLYYDYAYLYIYIV